MIPTSWLHEQVQQWAPTGADWDLCQCGQPRCQHDVYTPHCGIRFRCAGFAPADRKA